MTFNPNKPPKHIKQTENVNIPEEDGTNRLPTIKIMQHLSPEIDEEEEKHIEGAKVGMILITNGVQHMLIDGKKGIDFIPISVRKQWVEWIPRKQGGGFVASYDSKEEMEIGFTAGNEITITIDYLVLSTDIDPEGEITPALLQFNSPTKMAKAREMRAHIEEYKTMEGVTYKLSVIAQKNRAGQKFYNFKIEPIGWTNKQVMGAVQGLIEDYTPLFLPEEDTAF